MRLSGHWDKNELRMDSDKKLEDRSMRNICSFTYNSGNPLATRTIQFCEHNDNKNDKNNFEYRINVYDINVIISCTNPYYGFPKKHWVVTLNSKSDINAIMGCNVMETKIKENEYSIDGINTYNEAILKHFQVQ